MSLDPNELSSVLATTAVVEPRRRRSGPLVAMAAVVVVTVVGAGAWGSRSALRGLVVGEEKPLPTLEVDRGSLVVSLVEAGSLESAFNTSIKCQVEALIGTTGGASGTGRSGSSAGSAQGGSASGQSGGSSGSGPSNASGGATAKAKTGSTAKAKGGSAAKGSSGGSTAKGSSGGSTAKASTGPAATPASITTGDSAASASGNASSSSSSGSSSAVARPTIRSFSYTVPKYVPLRGATTAKAATKAVTTPAASAGGGGGRGGRGGSSNADEKPGSTRIIEIKPEGTEVKPGEVICQLDSSPFRSELQAQRIRWLQAKSWVEQAESILDVNRITYREYKDGVFPQDLQLIRQYIASCELQVERARRNETWSREAFAKRYRATAQYQADRISLEQSERALIEARGMESRLMKYTGPRLTKSLEATLQSITADKLAQDASFAVEDDRLRRLEKNVAACTIRAPKEGILVYANQTNGWGRTEVQIQEGVTVREGQTLFDLPDPKHMRVKVKVNESKMASVRPGQRALVTIEAFPGRSMAGTVAEITPIPAAQNRFSDIKIYFATVNIDSGGFEGLRPGMTAEVAFLIDSAEDATRVPLQAVRREGGETFVAVAARPGESPRWAWRRVALGRMGATHAEVVDGLTPGDRVVAAPDLLPAPTTAPRAVVAAPAPASGG